MKKLILSIMFLLLSTGVYADNISVDKVFTQLAATGNTSTIDISGIRNHTIMYKIAGIATNVVVRPEVSLDGTVWSRMDASNEDTTILAADVSATGGYKDEKSGFAGNLFRVTYVSESGAGIPSVDIKYTGHN